MNYYQPQYQGFYQQPIQQAVQPQTDDRQWVSNQQGAEVYPMQPNSFMRLWSSAEPIFYEKRTDATGRPLPLVAYRYEEISQRQPEQALNNDAEQSLREEIKALKDRLTALEGKGKKSKKGEEDA